MRIAFLVRATLFTQPGGDTLQVEQTAKYLRDLDCKVKILVGGKLSEASNSYDLLHCFNLIRPADAKAIHKSKLPFVISSIYHDYSEYDKLYRSGLSSYIAKIFGKHAVDYIKTVMRWLNGTDQFPGLNYLLKGQKRSMQILLKKSRAVIATSYQELNFIKKDLGHFANGHKIKLGSEHIKVNTHELEKEGVFCAARIEGPKNQLNLIKALKGSNLKLRLSGKSAPNQKRYKRQCQAMADSNTQFLGRISKEDLNLEFAKAKVHALVSYYETTGLSTLEALKTGCQVVVSDRGPQRELFEDKAYYCEPSDCSSIKKAIDKALLGNENHQKWVEENFSWKAAAEEIQTIYKSIIDHKQP